MAIIESFRLFNEAHKDDCCASSILLEHLDNTCPQWKQLIKNPACWKEVFEFEPRLYFTDWRKSFAETLFDIIGNIEAERMVFENENVDNWYQFAAARRLLKQDPDGFINEYNTSVLTLISKVVFH